MKVLLFHTLLICVKCNPYSTLESLLYYVIYLNTDIVISTSIVYNQYGFLFTADMLVKNSKKKLISNRHIFIGPEYSRVLKIIRSYI